MFLKKTVLGLTASGAVAAAISVCDGVYPHLPMSADIYTETQCTTAGGCWSPSDDVKCFFPKINGYAYSEYSSVKGKTIGNLTLISPSGALGPDFNDLTVEITQETASRTHVKIYPNGVDRWEIPNDIIERPTDVYEGNDALAQMFIPSSSPFELGMRRGKDVIFFMSKMLVFQDQYIQTVLSSPSSVTATYGFGESSRLSQAIQSNTSYSLWNVDNAASNFDSSLYGSHPFYVQVLEDGSAFGAAFMNSNAMAASIWDAPGNPDSISFQTAGGILDFYIFAGPTPLNVVKQFQELVGTPALMPFWSMGFHNCKWGYTSLEQVKEVVDKYAAAGVPLETQWTDIDYMQNWWDFTTDAVTFPADQFQSFISDLHNKNMHFVPIVDPGIYAIPGHNYDAQTAGLEQKVFVQDLTGITNYVGSVWPGPTYFPDWYATNATSYWTQQLTAFHDLLAFDGIWIDMNEVSNFENENGVQQVCVLVGEALNTIQCKIVDLTNTYDFPPWQPETPKGSLGGKTLPMSARHQNGVKEYDTHNLYGLMEAMATHIAVSKATSQRPFVLSRSTAFSSGKYTAHWTGDNAATWKDLQVSIITMNTLSLFGISMTGADICGFGGDTTEELCGRWTQVGAFSTFMRNHNAIGQIPQEFYVWDSVAGIAKSMLQMRYQLLPHLYTLLYSAHKEGSTVHTPLWMNFASDAVTTSGETDGQYMWGNSILFTPVLVQGASTVQGYFPKGIWFPLFQNSDATPTLVKFGAIDTVSEGGGWVSLDTPFERTNAHIRGGSVIPMQGVNTGVEQFMTTAALRQAPYSLRVALCEHGGAHGRLFLDDGIQQQLDVFTDVDFSVRSLTRPITKQRVFSVLSTTVSANGAGGAYAGEPLNEIVVNDYLVMAASDSTVRRSAPMSCKAAGLVHTAGSSLAAVVAASSVGETEVVDVLSYLQGIASSSGSTAVTDVITLPAAFDTETGLVRIDTVALNVTVSADYVVVWRCV